MSPMLIISITLAGITLCVWLQESHSPADIDHRSPFAFAFGVFVRLLLMVVIMVAVSIGMSAFWISL